MRRRAGRQRCRAAAPASASSPSGPTCRCRRWRSARLSSPTPSRPAAARATPSSCVTNGLLATVPRDQVRGVLAHELMHVRHRDILHRLGRRGGGHRRLLRRQHGDVGRALRLTTTDRPSPIVTLLARRSWRRSRPACCSWPCPSRECDADRGAAELLGTGEPLASALHPVEAAAPTRQWHSPGLPDLGPSRRRPGASTASTPSLVDPGRNSSGFRSFSCLGRRPRPTARSTAASLAASSSWSGATTVTWPTLRPGRGALP